MAKLLTPDYRFITVRPADGRKFTADELRTLVGGDFTIVVNWRGRPVVVNASHQHLPRNAWASAMNLGETLGGHAVLCKPSELAAVPLPDDGALLPSFRAAQAVLVGEGTDRLTRLELL